jgi:hypothetical protein
MPEDDPVRYLYEVAHRAFAQFGMGVLLPMVLEPMFRDTGIENIQCIIKKVPIGSWARDKTLRVIGMYQKMAVPELLPALRGRPFSALGLSQVEMQSTLGRARQGLAVVRVHRYFRYLF